MIDYELLASDYARHRQVNPMVLKELLTEGKIDSSSLVLEVGCGTGNYSVAIQSGAGCQVWGIDPSEQMLARAKGRSDVIHWQNGRAEELDISDNFFDLVFSVDVIHHIADRLASYKEAYRVLKPCGRVCTVTDSEWIIRHRQPLSVYFPETIEVELKRYPSLEELKHLMQNVGFQLIHIETVEFSFMTRDIQPYRDKVFSSLCLISEEAFKAGIQRMEEALSHGSIQCVPRYSMVWGIK